MNKRLSKYDYFMKRYTEAKDRGDSRKANYYATRINQLRKVGQVPLTKAEKQSRIKMHFDALTEGQRLIEMNKFITKMADQGMTINQSVAFLNSCGLDSTEIAHATTFSYEDMAHLSFYRENL